MVNIQELKAIPSNARPKVKIGSTVLYGSPELDNQFVESMRNSPIVNPIWKKIDELIKSGIVNPCYLSKGFFSFLINKIFSPHEESGTLGFFSPATKKVYVIVDNWASLFGSAPDEGIARTLVHECTHLFAYTKPTDFLSTFKTELASFYGEFLSRYFRASKQKPDVMMELASFIFNEFEMSTSQQVSFKNYWSKLEKLFKSRSSLNSKDFDEELKIYFVMIKFLFTNINLLRQYYLTSFRSMYVNMYRGYQHGLDIKPNGTLLVQELVFPSEIMCVVASHGTKGQMSKIYSSISKL